MIPKIIHYCWFGRNPLPELAKQCIASWKRFLPDYEIREWNEDNFDVNIIPYTAEAYKQKKYAFVNDYARFWILYRYGGIYFDTDVEVIRPLDDIIAKGNFMGVESDYCKEGGFDGKSDDIIIKKNIFVFYNVATYYCILLIKKKGINKRRCGEEKRV